ncbi:hypothetical protein [Streptomyces sp. NPDC093544]|uniref:TlpA family protein disulfide reductase n=1 Tax=Streptomyces sp. NPDC093544 TaxID=3155200 RepID=UPI003438944B
MAIFLSTVATLIACLSGALSLAVALRVKRLLDPLTQGGHLGRDQKDPVLVGSAVPDVGTLTDVYGESVELPLNDNTSWVLSFQSTTCTGCKQQLPGYKRYLESLSISKDRILSVIFGDIADVGLYEKELGHVSRVVHLTDGEDRLSREIGVASWPTYLVVSEAGTIAFSSNSSAQLAESIKALD